jgi:hypothetical protein
VETEGCALALKWRFWEAEETEEIKGVISA